MVALRNLAPVVEYWKSDFHTTEPVSEVVPYVWPWNDLRQLLDDALENVSAMDAERRLLCLSNPGLDGAPYVTNTLLADVQALKPGERAPAHRHTTNSVRLSLEGDGAYTMVDGEKCYMNRGDVVTNLNWAWHHHGNEGTENVIWMDVLDVPLVTTLGATTYDYDYAKEGDADPHFISVTEPSSRSEDLFSTGGIYPTFVHGSDVSATPQVVYRWERTRETLERMKKYDGDPYDGIIVELGRTMTGERIYKTMSVYMQLLRPGEKTRTHRHSSSAVYCVLEGQGYTQVGDKRLDWKTNDMFCLPTWSWHHHVNLDETADAVLYSVSDIEAARIMGLYREEAMTDAGDAVAVKR
jgi:gentisate 1,2-dioxygenase